MDINALVERSKQGDISAFEELISGHQQKIYNLAYSLTGNYHDANDLAQDAFIRVFKALPNYRGDASFYSWVYSIVTNLYRDYLRKKANKKEEFLEKPLQLNDEKVTKEVGSMEYDPATIYHQQQQLVYLQGLVADLPADYKEILAYREFLGYSYQEISEKLDLPLGTIKSRISRGRKLLQEQIAKDGILEIATLKNKTKPIIAP